MMRLAGSGAEPAISTVRGEYRAIEPPGLLTYTWIREEGDYPETLVSWELKHEDGYTRVRVTHSGLVTKSLRERNSGWPLIVGLLKGYIEGEPKARI